MASPTKPARADAKKLLASARRPERTYNLCLRGDLVGEWEQLNRQLEQMGQRGPSSLAGDDRVKVAARMEELSTEMQASMMTLTIRSMRRDEYRDLEAAHPPRPMPQTPKAPKKPKGYDDGEASDGDAEAYETELAAHEEALAEHAAASAKATRDQQAGGFNSDTFYGALLEESVADPELDDEDWEQILDVVTDRQFDELCGLALVVNRGEVSVPFSPTASRLTRSSAPS